MAERRRSRGNVVRGYRDIAACLRTEIETGVWPTGQVIPAYRKLMRIHSAGERTVRLALDLLKREGWLRAIARRRLVAARPEPGRAANRNVVALVMSNSLEEVVGLSYASEALRGIQLGVSALEAPLMLLHGRDFVASLPAGLSDLSLRGIILMGLFEPDTLRAYERISVPVVLADHPGGPWQLHSSSVDNIRGTCDAVNRLFDLGHRRIAFLRRVHTGLKAIDPDSAERQRGFSLAFTQKGLPPPKDSIFNSFFNDNERSATVRAVFDRRPRFTAAVTSDAGGVQLLKSAARLYGLTVPRDLSLVTVHSGGTGRGAFSGPGVDFVEVGRQAALLLSHPKRPVRHTRVATKWTPGKTIGPPPRYRG